MKRKILIALCIVMMILAMLMLIYPIVSNWYNQHKQSSICLAYAAEIEKKDNTALEKMYQEAEKYNKAIAPGCKYSEEELNEASADYENLLNINKNGIMGYVEIPKLDINLPIYHGTESSTLELGCGHLLGSSLPIGGKGTHSILTAHSGLASKKMFSDIDLLENGDQIKIQVLNKALVYEVFEKNVILPEETEDIGIRKNMDLCSLITCTPFGVNTHRLVVTARRVVEAEEKIENVIVESSSLSIWEQEYLNGISKGLSLLAILCTMTLPVRIYYNRKNRKGRMR